MNCLSYTHDNDEIVKQLLIIYVNTSKAGPAKTAQLLSETRTSMFPILHRLPKDTGAIFLPTKTRDTCVELVPYFNWNGAHE